MEKKILWVNFWDVILRIYTYLYENGGVLKLMIL